MASKPSVPPTPASAATPGGKGCGGKGKGKSKAPTTLPFKVRTSAGGSFAEELDRRRNELSKVNAEEIHDSSNAPQGFGFEDFGAYQRYMQCFNIERWLQELGDATFETRLVSISRKEACSLITLHQNKASPEDLDAARSLLADVAKRLQVTMDAVALQHGCFVKTSSRSAKDNADSEAIQNKIDTALKCLNCSDENAQLVACSYASMQLLRFSQASQVLHIFVGSERIWHDMELALAQSVWDEALVVRRWVELEPDMEFRCFVSGDRLTAVSQYRHLVHFPRVVKLRDELISGIVAFFENTVQPRLVGLFEGGKYIVDFAVELKGGDINNIMCDQAEGCTLGKWWCIEVNPFYETTDACMFSWNKERSLLEGKSLNTVACSVTPPEFRFRERPSRGALSLVYGQWREALQKCVGHEAARYAGGGQNAD